MAKTIVNNNIKLKSGGGIINDATDGLSVDVFQGVFGDGSDGDITISSDTSLARDMYYENLTINNGVTLTSSGFRIFVRGTLTNNGTISAKGNDGTNGANATADGIGTGGPGGAALATGTIYGGLAGGAGADGVTYTGQGERAGKATSAGTNLNPSITGVNGAKGGNGGQAWGNVPGGVAGDGGTATLEVALLDALFSIVTLNAETIFDKGIPYLLRGITSNFILSSSAASSGGGSGGVKPTLAGVTTSSGGGGGAGSTGGIVYIQANIIVNNGTITANGGNGGNGGNAYTTNSANSRGGGSGGGAGGSGGLVVLIYNTYPTAGTVTVAGGTGGAGGTYVGGSGADNGGNGAAGNAGKYIQLKLS